MRTSEIAAFSVLASLAIVGSISLLISELRGFLAAPPAPAGAATREQDEDEAHGGPGRPGRPGQPGRLGGPGWLGSPSATDGTNAWSWLAAAGWVRLMIAALVGAAVGWATRWPVAGLACAGMVAAWPVFASGRRTERREIDVLEAVVVWTQGLRDTVAGGASLEQAIGVSVDGAPPVLRPALEQVRSNMLVRQSLDASLAPLRAVPGADFVSAALMLAARRRGDRLPDVLSGMVATCGQEVAQRRQVQAARAGIHRSVQIIVGVTVAILTWMATVGAAYMAPYDSAGGQGLLALVVAVIAAGFLWLTRLDTSTTGPRFFTAALTPSQDRLVAHLIRPPARSSERSSDYSSGRSSDRPVPGPGSARAVRPSRNLRTGRDSEDWA